MGTRTNAIGYVAFDTPGNATDFGDLSVTRKRVSGTSNLTRAVFIGGSAGSGNGTMVNTIDYVTIDTAANATDFGDIGNTGFQSMSSTSGAAS
tara:strand:+ start:501 stop:779 length:279 start_codon:yes stop_codon:yes gene_type:complete